MYKRQRGEFAENSMFAEELRCYFRGQREFVDLSVQVAEFIAGELGRMEKTCLLYTSRCV